MTPTSIRFVLDEHLRGKLWRAIERHNQGATPQIDVAQIGDPPAPSLGTKDPDILIWAESTGRIVVTADKKTMPDFLAAHLLAGRHLPGMIILLPRCTLSTVVDCLALATAANDPADWEDCIKFLG